MHVFAKRARGQEQRAVRSRDDAQLQQLQQMDGAGEMMQDLPATDASGVTGAAGVLGYVKGAVEQDGHPVTEQQAQDPGEEEEAYLSDE